MCTDGCVRYGCFESIIGVSPPNSNPDAEKKELNDYLIYADESPVSYLLNGYDSVLITFANQSKHLERNIIINNLDTCKSRTLFSDDLNSPYFGSKSILAHIIKNVINFCDIQKKKHLTLGISIAQIGFSYEKHSMKLVDLLSFKSKLRKRVIFYLEIRRETEDVSKLNIITIK
jgi:hypothetical protein